MRDLIERLRESVQNNDCEGCGDAADELATLKARLAECKDDLVVAMRERNDAEARLAAAERDAERWREFVKRSPLIAASCVAALDAARADGAGESTRTCKSCGFVAKSDGWLNCPRCTAAATPPAGVK